jgi:hypothetical protein
VTPRDDNAEYPEHNDGDDACACLACERDALRALDERAQRIAAVGGIAPWAHEALGPGWLDADSKGASVVQPISTEELAQRALGDVFEQLERVGATGRERCRAGLLYTAAPLTQAQRVRRHEAVKLLRFAENALDYARVHLDYLELDEPERLDDDPDLDAAERHPVSVYSE